MSKSSTNINSGGWIKPTPRRTTKITTNPIDIVINNQPKVLQSHQTPGIQSPISSKYVTSNNLSRPKKFRQTKITSSVYVGRKNDDVDLSTLDEFKGGSPHAQTKREEEVNYYTSSSSDSPILFEEEYDKENEEDELKKISEQINEEEKEVPTEIDNDVVTNPKDDECLPKWTSFKMPIVVPSKKAKAIVTGKGQLDERVRFGQKVTMTVLEEEEDHSKPSNAGSLLNLTADMFRDFDKLPERDDLDMFNPVRGKDDRARLQGWDCDLCREYYKPLEAEMHPSELQRLKNNCSRHRSNRPMNQSFTPPDVWRTTLPSTQEALERGLIKIGVASPPVRRKRHDLLD